MISKKQTEEKTSRLCMYQRQSGIILLVILVAIIFRTSTTTIMLESTMPSSKVRLQNCEIVTQKLKQPNNTYMLITGYCACRQCVGEWYTDNPVKYGASGRELISGYSVATNSLPMGTIIYIDGREYRVDDRGTTGIDIYYDTHEGACSVGCSTKEVMICG